jgi:nitroreductase
MEVMEAIRSRRSIRKFRSKELPREHLELLLETARLAPSGANRQPWEMVVVTDLQKMKDLVPLCKNQMFIADCCLFLVGIDDPQQKWARVDVTIALDHVTLAAQELGLGTCWIGAFDGERLGEHLEIPRGRIITICLAIGYPDESPEARNRKPMEDLFHKGTYGRH